MSFLNGLFQLISDFLTSIPESIQRLANGVTYLVSLPAILPSTFQYLPAEFTAPMLALLAVTIGSIIFIKVVH